MIAEKLLAVASTLVLLITPSCKTASPTVEQPVSHTSSLSEREEIVAAIDIDLPGYFTYGGRVFGYPHDLLKEYASDRGLRLTFIPGNTQSDIRRLIVGGGADIAISLRVADIDEAPSVGIYQTGYMVISAENGVTAANEQELMSLLSGSSIMISPGFRETTTYDNLLGSLGDSHVYISHRSIPDLMEALSTGEYEYMICEWSEAMLGMALNGNIREVYRFAEETAVVAVITPQTEGLAEDFTRWLTAYNTSVDHSMLTYTYFSNGISGQLLAMEMAGRQAQSISAYDDIMREVCEREGADWRFLSAIAYHESRFKADVVSNMGAQGLMQIMPSTARQFQVSTEDMGRPEVNILLAVKLLNRIERTLKLPRTIPYSDKMALVLASYNCGVGHVSDARRLAKKYGADPDCWDDVSQYLRFKSDPAYYNDRAVQCGRFSPAGARQTLAFVNGVMGRYSAYCLIAQK